MQNDNFIRRNQKQISTLKDSQDEVEARAALSNHQVYLSKCMDYKERSFKSRKMVQFYFFNLEINGKVYRKLESKLTLFIYTNLAFLFNKFHNSTKDAVQSKVDPWVALKTILEKLDFETIKTELENRAQCIIIILRDATLI